MALSLKPEHLKRYRDIARLLMKYGRSDIVKSSGLDKALEAGDQDTPATAEEAKLAEELAADLEKMGPLYVKLGQVLSSRSDLLPPAYVRALARLQDKLEPFPFAEVETIVQSELGVRLSKAFAEFDPKPLAAASLGQVHRALLRSGRPVVVKVQRPGVRETIAHDLDALEPVAEFLDQHTEWGQKVRFTEALEDLRKSLIRELDYRQEAGNLRRLHENLQEFERLVVPLPIDDYCTSRVLTMEYIRGRKITSLGPLAFQEINGNELLEELFRAYLKQILLDGFFHADPHAGNVFMTDDGRLALIDLGMVGQIVPSLRERMLKLLLAVSEGQSDTVAEQMLAIGERLETLDEPRLRRRVAELVTDYQNVRVEDLEIGRAILDLSNSAVNFGLRMPSELTLLGKTLLSLDEIARILAPEFDPNEAIRRDAAEITRRWMMQEIKVSNVLSSAIEAKEFVEALPGRVNRILDALARNDLKLNVETIDEATLIEGFQKVANRITTGLILAALIIGAAMLMRVETDFRLFGYPGFAMLCFLAAAGGGFWLVMSILLSDHRTKTGVGRKASGSKV